MATVLVIDDEPDLIAIMKTFLEETDHEVIAAQNGVEGQEVISKHSIDLVVADIVMPEQGGMEMVMMLARRHPDIKWILVTGRIPVQAHSVQSFADQFGVQQIIEKPFTKRHFLTTIETALAGESARE